MCLATVFGFLIMPLMGVQVQQAFGCTFTPHQEEFAASFKFEILKRSAQECLQVCYEVADCTFVQFVQLITGVCTIYKNGSETQNVTGMVYSIDRQVIIPNCAQPLPVAPEVEYPKNLTEVAVDGNETELDQLFDRNLTTIYRFYHPKVGYCFSPNASLFTDGTKPDYKFLFSSVPQPGCLSLPVFTTASMSLLGSHKAQLTKAANILRKKVAEVEQTNLESESLTFDTGKDYDFVINRRNFLSDLFSSISCAASYLRAQREKAEKFALSKPDEQGEFPFLIEIHAHWDAGEFDDLLVEADILLERLDNKIKLLPNADMLYERHLSSIASTQPSSNPASSPCSSDTVQPQAPPHPAQVSPFQDRPSDPSSVALVDHHPLVGDAGIPQQGDQCPRASSGFGNPFLTCPPAHTSMHPFASQTPLPNPGPNLPLASTSGPSSSTSYSLPSFEIPYFSGDMDAFHEFWNIFVASIHNNNSVPVAVKFMYLKTHLKGDAANIIANFQPTEENYEDAVRTIISTYDRPEHLRMRLWEKLNKQAPAKDSAASQRATLGSIRAIWSQMKRLKEESSIGALNTIRSKFPRRTREKVGEMKKKEDQMWTVDELLTAFDTVIDRLQVVEDADPTPSAIYNSDSTVRQTSSSPRRYSSDRPQQVNSSQYQPSTCPTCLRPLCTPSEYRTARSRSPTPYYPRRSSRSPARPQHRAYQNYCCAFCLVEGHRPEDCLEVPYPTQRRTIVKQEGLCWLCLDHGHFASVCSAPPCGYCGRTHHLALCLSRPRASKTFTPTTSFHRRPVSPKRVQFDTEAQSSSDRAQQRSRSSSPRVSARKSPSPSRRQRSPVARRASSVERAHSAHPILQNSICTSSNEGTTRRDAPSELIAEDQAQIDPRLPSSCAVTCQRISTHVPRLMVVHALTFNVKTNKNELLTVFLDSGSQYSFVRTSLAFHLGLPLQNNKTITTLTFGGHQFTENSSKVTLTLWDKFDRPIDLQLWTRDVITTVPRINNINDVTLDYSDERVEVDVLIGIDNYWRIVDLNRNERLPSGLILSHTRFGPVLSGSVYPAVANTISATTVLNDDAPGTEQLVRSLLGLDTVGLEEDETSADASTIRHFYDTVRVIDGNIYVSFPWRSEHPPLADNKALAFRRLQSQYERFLATPSAWKEYCETFDAQLRSGIIEDVTRTSAQGSNVYYIPHQAVCKQESSTTKLRIVFDASSHQRGHPSLNDCLHQGPSLLPDLVGTLLRSRFHRYLVIADVEKAFHQIHLHQDPRDFTRFLWLKDVHKPPSSENLRVLRFTRVPFGINASPFLLNMAIRYFLERSPGRLNEEILANTYVDNVIVGAESTEECLRKQQECKEIFARMHMNLREFMSNNHQLMEQIPDEDCMKVHGQYVKFLGIKWNPLLDLIYVPIKIARQSVSSKRTALQVYASTFDPLGLLIPLLIRPKMFIQDLWESGYSWDGVLSEQDMQKWDTIVKDMKDFHSQVPRFIGLTRDSMYDLVVCSDASKRAYAVAVYILARPKGRRLISNLLFAKAKLAPPGAITIPRMELLACHMAAKTVQFLRTQLKIHLQSIRFLTDSQIVLYWIQTSKPLKTFVANRVKYIRHVLDELKSDKIDSGFYYINTDDNPADCATRGLTALELQDHIWWTGPSFFTTPFSVWPCKSFDSSAIPPAGGEAEEFQTTARVAPPTAFSTSCEHLYRADARKDIQGSQSEH